MAQTLLSTEDPRLLAPSPPTRLLSSHEVCVLSGVTFRQLDYWCRTGLLEPAAAANGSGSHRRWTVRQAALVRAVRFLADAGAPDGAKGALVSALEADWSLWDGWVLVAGEVVAGRDRWGRCERRWEGEVRAFDGTPAQGWLVDAASALAHVTERAGSAPAAA